MTDVSSSYTYLSIADVDIYSYSTIDIKDVTLCNIGSYGGNVETKMIDGKKCLVIPVDDYIEVNGIQALTMKSQKKQKEETEK